MRLWGAASSRDLILPTLNSGKRKSSPGFSRSTGRLSIGLRAEPGNIAAGSSCQASIESSVGPETLCDSPFGEISFNTKEQRMLFDLPLEQLRKYRPERDEPEDF